MTLEREYRFECDNLRLLVDTFEKLNEQYTKENDKIIRHIEVYDPNTYQAPKYIWGLKALLTSSLLIEDQSLLDFYLPKIIKLLAKNKNVQITPFDKTWKKGGVLSWAKHVLKKEIKTKFNFNQDYYRRLNEF